MREMMTDPWIWAEALVLFVGLVLPMAVFSDHSQVAALSATSGSVATSIVYGWIDR